MRWLILSLYLPMILFAESVPQPEFSSGYTPREAVYAQKMMVASANPYASQAGMEILQKGGNAIDAVIAMQMVLGVVEPQSSGIGGGAFLLYYQRDKKQVLAYDGRETAPAEVHEEWFLDKNKKPIEFSQAVVGGRSVGVPGLLKMLEEVHREKGVLPWKELFTPAIDLANQGFPISSRLHQLVDKTANLETFPTTQSYLFEEGKAKEEGTLLKNPELAQTLHVIAELGTDPFYKGAIAQKIVSAVKNAPVSPGVLSLSDLENYQPKKRKPTQTNYRGYIVYGFPPPSAGGIILGQMLKMIETQKLDDYSLGSVDFINLFCRASRLAFADRDYYVADPDYFPVPSGRLLNTDYLQKRALEIHDEKQIKAGSFPGQSVACCPPLHLSNAIEFPSTTQICVVDQEGNGVSMTTSVENAFGSTLMVGGFFLNNQLTDFSLVPEKEGKKAANRIEPGKRPMSSMTPTLVFKQGSDDLLLTIGSAGGSRIINYVAQALFGVLDFNMNIQEAIDYPHYTSIREFVDLEKDTSLIQDVPALEKLGNKVVIKPLTSGTQGIQRTEKAIIGGVDPRREGLALGK